MKQAAGRNTVSERCYSALRWMVKVCYPKVTLEGLENLPQGPCLLVGNHCQMHGPIIGELYIPGKRAIWCTSEMMDRKQVPAYAYQDFWSEKPRYTRWFYRLLSHLIAPVSACIFNEAHTIPVYRDDRILKTFRLTMDHLMAGSRVVVFPECPEPYNQIVNRFQNGFADIGRLYEKRTGEPLPFVPMYVAPKLRKVCLGKPVFWNDHVPREQAREEICQELMHRITEMAQALPRHTVVPYRNVSKKEYPTNVSPEVDRTHEKARC
jgi:hypothetical protein